MDFTPILRPYFVWVAKRTDVWSSSGDDVQRGQLHSLLCRARNTEIGRRYGFDELSGMQNAYSEFRRRVPTVGYEDIRDEVMRMIRGEKNILWP